LATQNMVCSKTSKSESRQNLSAKKGRDWRELLKSNLNTKGKKDNKIVLKICTQVLKASKTQIKILYLVFFYILKSF